MASGDTIAAIATASGRGGVAVIRISGPEAFALAEKLTGRRPEPGKIGLRRIDGADDGIDRARSTSTDFNRHPSASKPIDEAVVLAFKSPRSYTGEDVVELQCHGGAVTPRRVLEACLAAGARLARRGEFTERAFLNGRLDYGQAESVLDLIDARTVRAADAALEGLSGRRTRETRDLYETALGISVRIEHALDVSEEELPEGFCDGVDAEIAAFRSRLAAAVRRLHEGKILREGALVVLAGPPNAGKSSLMNVLLDENRAIVSDVPGTTRDFLEEWLDLDGWPVRLVDTAGLHETADGVEAEGVRRARELIAKADVVIWLNGCAAAKNPDLPIPRLLDVHPKCDLGRGGGLNVSAKTGEGLDDLRRAIVGKLEAKVSAADAGEAVAGDAAAFHEALALLTDSGARSATQDSRFPAPGPSGDLVLTGNLMRQVADVLGRAVGAVYSEDLLDNLFSRFCVGK